MASIPILAAVAAAIIVPVAGTGIYYSVRPSKQKEGEASEELARRLHDHERAVENSESNLLQINKIAQRGESEEQFEARAKHEREEAKASIDELLQNRGSLDLNSVFPSSFESSRTNWASSHSSSSLRRP